MGAQCVFLLLSLCVLTAQGRSTYLSTFSNRILKRGNMQSEACQVLEENHALHSLMDRVCELCHEMLRGTNPNLRAKCRSNCFENDQFASCSEIFNIGAAGLMIPPARREQLR